jgi:FAD-dependent urate hydroxylase
VIERFRRGKAFGSFAPTRSFAGRCQSAEVVVVGAGPYGLSIAAYLRLGSEARLFGIPMGGWRNHMPKGMFLKSAFDASSLAAPAPGWELKDYYAAKAMLPVDGQHVVPLRTFIEYGLWFQRHRVPDVDPRAVSMIAKVGDRFSIRLSDGELLSARQVVIASGHVSYAYAPPEVQSLRTSSALGSGTFSHACEHSDFSTFRRRSVAVIGAGQSALESAVLLYEAGAEVHLLVRSSAILWGSPPRRTAQPLPLSLVKPNSPLGPGWSHVVLSRAPQLVSHLSPAIRLHLVRTVLGPSGGWWLRQRFEGRVNVEMNTAVAQARPTDSGRVVLRLATASGAERSLEVDHVLAATGYRIDLAALRFLDPIIASSLRRVPGSAAPALTRNFESSVPGLYFTGLTAAPTFGPVLRFVCGTAFTAQTISRAILSSRAPLVTRPVRPDQGPSVYPRPS